MTQVTRPGGATGLNEQRQRNAALRVLQGDGLMVYAVRTRDGLIKIGASADVAERVKHIKGGTAVILALKPGTRGDELAIHRSLAGHATHGREYYFPTPAVLAVVNAMRVPLGLEPITIERHWAS